MKLGLGTAQFGYAYGVTNRVGSFPTRADIRKILCLAKGIDYIDTAPLYGNSEKTLGECWPPASDFKIITKTRPKSSSVMAHVADSLRKLRQKSVYGLLVHRPQDLFDSAGKEILNQLIKLKEKRLVEKIGVSFTSPNQIDKTLKLFTPDLIQIPVNVFDRRFIHFLPKLKALGIEIHARSVFLQGILLEDPTQKYFEPYLPYLHAYKKFADDLGISRMTAALKFVYQQEEIDAAIVGAGLPWQLDQILNAVRSIPNGTFDTSSLTCTDENFFDPVKWKV